MKDENILLMPFLDESASFVHGFECGKLWNLIEEGERLEHAVDQFRFDDEEIFDYFLKYINQ